MAEITRKELVLALIGVSIEGNPRLRGLDLSGLDMNGLNLIGADLCKTDLHKANLRGANLRGANHNKYTVWPTDFDTEHLK